jgi:hypothetical protein
MMFRMMRTVSALLLLLALVCDALASSGSGVVSLSCSAPRCPEIRRSSSRGQQKKHPLVASSQRRLACLHVCGGGSIDNARRRPLTGNSAPPPSLNLLQRYSRLVDTRPLTTKAITAGSVAALADIVTQAFVLQPMGGGGVVSWRRVVAFLLAGALFVGPYGTVNWTLWCGHCHVTRSAPWSKCSWINRSVSAFSFPCTLLRTNWPVASCTPDVRCANKSRASTFLSTYIVPLLLLHIM